MSSIFPTGVWKTYAPLDQETVKDHKVRLLGLVAMEATGVHIRTLEVYVDGVLWEYERIPVAGEDW